MSSGDLERLRALETAMWTTTTRGDVRWMDEHLSPTFTEFGRSGANYTRPAMLEHHVTDIDIVLPLTALEVRPLGDDVALVTYRSIEGRGPAHRASVWRRSGNDAGWQLEFHQGTPTTP